ncbi:hypothetical protein BGZ76_005040 [Entomortierella beljakovae]|nr:hypothetical protein BGZ76_005040 [Entomortierella beljakovae]
MHPKPADTTIIPADHRSVFPLPFPRNSDDGEDLGDRYGYYDPQDLFSCQDIDVSDLRTTLCHFNQLTMILSALIGLVVILEGVLTFIIETRSHTHPSLNKSLTKKRAEHYEESELGNAQVVVPMSPRPFSEPYPYGVDSQNASLPNPGQFELDERPLPDLPDWNGKKLPVPDYSSDVKNPFASDLKDSKHAWAGSEGKDESNDYTQDIAGPSNTFPEDVKHKDGH